MKGPNFLMNNTKWGIKQNTLFENSYILIVLNHSFI